MPSDSYPYAVGRIKGLERSLLNAQDFSRMVEQPLSAAIKHLADLGYGQHAEDKSDPDFLVAAEMKALRLAIDELTPAKPLTDLFWLEQDAVNLKLLLKARLLGEDVPDANLAFGLYPQETLREAVSQKDYTALGAPLAEGLTALEALLRKGDREVSPFEISTAVDNAVYAHIFCNKKNTFVKNFFSAKVDFTNILSFLRARKLGWDKAKFTATLLAGGQLPVLQFQNAYELPSGEAEVSLPRGSAYDSALRQALGVALTEDGSIAAASNILSQKLMELAAAERFDSFGIGPIVYYLFRKIEEGKKLRVLFAQKRSGEVQ